MHGVLCHLCDVGPAVPVKSWVVVRGSAQRPLASGDARYSGSAARSQGRTYRWAPSTQKDGTNEDGVTGLQQSPLCIREEAKFITAHYGVQQMS